MENQILPGQVQSLIDALKSIGGGELSEQAADHLQQAVKAAMVEGKKASITIKLEITKVNSEMITVVGSSEAKIPKAKPSGSFFVDPMTNYSIGRNRPNQQILPTLGAQDV